MPQQIVRFDDATAVDRTQQLVLVAVARELANRSGMALRTLADDTGTVAQALGPIDDGRAALVDRLSVAVARELKSLQRHTPRSTVGRLGLVVCRRQASVRSGLSDAA